MKKHQILFTMLFVVILSISLSINAQVFSEAPITISAKGERLSYMIYVKLKSNDFVIIPEGKKFTDGNSISLKIFQSL